MDANLTSIIFSTYLGMWDWERAYDVVVDTRGDAYITGFDESNDLPVTANAFDDTFNGGLRDAYLYKISADGSTLLYCSYLGGSGEEECRSLFLTEQDELYMAGGTQSSDFPTMPGAYNDTLRGTKDIYLVKINFFIDSSNVDTTWSSTWSNTDDDQGHQIWTNGTNSYTIGRTNTGGSNLDLLLVKWDMDGNQVWNRTWGGPNDEVGWDVWSDGTNVYACGEQWDGSGQSQALLVKWHSNGTEIWNETWGGVHQEFAYGKYMELWKRGLGSISCKVAWKRHA
jgi:hypothetical protein